MNEFERYFEALRGKSIAVLGLGVSNRPLVRLLLEYGCQVTGCDKTPREKLDPEVLELEKTGCRLSVGEGYLDGLEADVVFRTPGMHPGNPAIVKLRQLGAEITSAVASGSAKGAPSSMRDSPSSDSPNRIAAFSSGSSAGMGEGVT